MADDKKGTTTTAVVPKAPRGRAPNKPKTRGQILGGVIDMFEAMTHDTREEVMVFLRRQYPATATKHDPVGPT